MTDTPTTTRSDGWGIITATIAVFALIVAGIAFVSSNGGETTVEAASATGGADWDGPPLELDVELGDLYVEPAAIEVEAGQPLLLHVHNAGVMPHDLVFDNGDGTRMLDPGDSETIEVAGLTQSTVAWCTVAGHREGGMEMTVTVLGGEATDAPVAAAADSGHADHATVASNAAWDAEFVPFDPTLEPAPGGTEHELTMRATEVQMEVAPGVFQEVWTFDDQVPGPVLRGKVGDLFTITLVNEGEIGHSIDFHSSRVAWNDEMRTIAPGEELVYQFRAEYAGVFMYHCGTAPALHHIGNGMFGVMIVDPPDLAEVDHEFVFVQHEWYLGPDGEPGSLSKMQNDEWDLVVFNGHWNQYAHAPIEVEPGERVRAWVLNAGPSENSSFHVVGTIFDTFYKEGSYQLRPDDGQQGGAQALDLQPAQGGFVEFSLPVDGLYPIVTHKFSNVDKGALGLFLAGQVDMDGDIAH